MGKSIKKIAKSVSKITKTVVDPLNLSGTAKNLLMGPQLPQPDTSATDALSAALQAQRATANVDLGLDNVAQTEVGGSAAEQANTTRRRRAPGAGGVATGLGIRV